jgi:hypothetical protein
MPAEPGTGKHNDAMANALRRRPIDETMLKATLSVVEAACLQKEGRLC